jgi:putative salt-induced outer membrane protein YdiY
VSAGLSLTSGNSDTLNYNLAFDFTRDRDAGHVFRATGLYLQGRQHDLVVANRTSLGLRDRYDFSPRGFVFGQLDYLRDTFKRIDYLVAPTAGVGLTVLHTDATTFAVDAGVGAVWEKNPERGVRNDAAVSAAMKLERKLTDTAMLKHAVNALWKAADPSDGLYTISIGLSTKLSERLQMSIDILDTFKNEPRTADTQQNDVALVTGITATF